MLDQFVVKTPCNMPWDDMVGDARSRFCCSCKKDVYDLTAMHPDEAEELLEQQLGGTTSRCVRMFRRPDGRLLTSDCAVGIRRRHMRRFTKTAAGVALAALLAAVATDVALRPVLGPDTLETLDPTGPLFMMQSHRSVPPPEVVTGELELRPDVQRALAAEEDASAAAERDEAEPPRRRYVRGAETVIPGTIRLVGLWFY